MNKPLRYPVVESGIQGLKEPEYNTGYSDAIRVEANG